MSQGISLHIGLNSVDPNGYGGWSGDLGGCGADAKDIQKLAKTLGYKPTSMLTKKATSTAVLKAVAGAAKSLKSGDAFFLTYSGHGGQTDDVNGDEIDDQLDETWCFYDRQVVDDEMYALYRQFAPGVRIFVLSDSCHSGTVLKALPPTLQPKSKDANYDLASAVPDVYKSAKGPIQYRFAPKKFADKNTEKYRDLLAAVQLVSGSAIQLDPQAGVLLISGCQDNQLSADLGTNGLFTRRLLDAYKQVGANATFRQLHKALLAKMPLDQTPNLMTVGIGGPALPNHKAFVI